ncbi:MAG: hypothetical protein KDI13_00060 [Alphaproteobacteria bacterium]|nr:hypothetical protein [Alphaproteobacteria bacterium]
MTAQDSIRVFFQVFTEAVGRLGTSAYDDLTQERSIGEHVLVLNAFIDTLQNGRFLFDELSVFIERGKDGRASELVFDFNGIPSLEGVARQHTVDEYKIAFLKAFGVQGLYNGAPVIDDNAIRALITTSVVNAGEENEGVSHFLSGFRVKDPTLMRHIADVIDRKANVSTFSSDSTASGNPYIPLH